MLKAVKGIQIPKLSNSHSDQRLSLSRIAPIALLLASVSSVIATDTPVIGIVAQELSTSSFGKLFPNYTSYIAASYVKNIEGAGARVVPIFIGKDREYYAKILSHINGVVFPGGEAYFDSRNGYADVGRHILPLAEKINQQGEPFPVLGVCLGFELFLVLAANDTDYRTKCRVQQVNLPLNFLRSLKRSSLFKKVPPKYIRKFAKLPLTHNNHVWCITKENMEIYNVTDTWRIVALSKHNEWEFVTAAEHKYYPFAVLQFHPEKNAYEWSEAQNNPHTQDAIVMGRFFSDWFMEKARLNDHSFPSVDSLYKSLINNYANVMPYPKSKTFEQVYLFNET